METTTNMTTETLEGLQDLIEINIDSSKGFDTAAEAIENSSIADMFRQCAAERRRFGDELSQYIRLNGGKPETTGSVKGAAHRWWLNIRGKVQDGDEHAVLAEAERGEDAIKAEYEKVLKNTAGSPVNDVLQQQYASVKARHDRIRDMRDSRA